MSKVSVGVNLLWLVPGEVGGSEESTTASLRALADLDDARVDLRLFVLEPMRSAHPDLLDSIPADVAPLRGHVRAARIAAESSWLAIRTRGLGLVHHAGGTAPLVRTAPYVLTLHDLQPLERHATHSAVKRAYLRATVPRSVRRARAVIVPSEFVRRSVLDHVGGDADKVVVIPHGVETFEPATPPDVLADRFGLHGPVVLYPAITYPHKNHRVLLDAFADVVRSHPEAVLVLPGSVGAEEERLREQIGRLGLRRCVRRPGRVSPSDMAGLYRTASVVAVPSRYEGFGLPAAEAMAYGAPVVAAAGTSLPEVVGDAGYLLDPDDVAGWSDAISGLLDAPAERARLAVAGRARAAALYSWRTNARRLADVYADAGRMGPAGSPL
ncbi:MAG: glycosyltransferase family 1 protein [Acidimicrobiales bacterium]